MLWCFNAFSISSILEFSPMCAFDCLCACLCEKQSLKFSWNLSLVHQFQHFNRNNKPMFFIEIKCFDLKMFIIIYLSILIGWLFAVCIYLEWDNFFLLQTQNMVLFSFSYSTQNSKWVWDILFSGPEQSLFIKFET